MEIPTYVEIDADGGIDVMRTSDAPGGRSRRWIVAVVIAVIGLPIAWYLGSPLFLSKKVGEAFPISATAEVPPGMTRQQVEDAMMRASQVQTTVTDAMPSSNVTPAVVRRGMLVNVDGFHRGSGVATVYRTGGRLVLRLDPFNVTNGPDLYVYLAGNPAPRNTAQLHDAGAVEVARLKGNIGAQNYSLPAALDLSKLKSVVIYCRRFHVVFSTAELAPQ